MGIFRKDERGSSLVMTIIAATFLSLLAAAVVSMTLTNIRLKQAQKKSQINFYNADSIVDAIRAGVENLSDSSAREAYEAAFAAYGAVRSGTTDSLKEKYAEKYMNSMIVALSDGECSGTSATNLYYKDNVIIGFLTEAQAKYNSGVFVDGYKSHTNGKGTMEYDADAQTLLLKDFTVKKTDNDYQTTINTDIRINLPEMTAETHSEYLNYALIADNKVKITGSGQNASVNGDVYSGTVRREDPSEVDEPQAGFVIDSGATLNINAENVISRGDLLIRAGSQMKINGLNGLDANVWVENVQTKPSAGGASGNNLEISGKTYVSDDLELTGDGDSIKLSGTYYGYNFNKDYSAGSATPVSNNANFSSSMILNGKTGTLNLSGLSELILSGKTFISKKGNVGESLAGAGTAYASSADIRTGESLTVKSSQLVYYVPRDYWKKVDSTGTSFTTPMVFTPIEGSSDQYEFDVDGYNEYIGIQGFDVRDYVDPSLPLSYYYRHDSKVKDEDLTYFYLNLRDDKLTDFYQVYASSSPDYDTVKDVNAKYMSGTGIAINENADAVLSGTGNVLYKEQASGEQKVINISNGTSTLQNPSLAYIAATLSLQYMSLQMSLTDDYDIAINSGQYRLSDNNSDIYTKKGTSSATSDKTNLFATLLDESKITDYESDSTSNAKLPADTVVVVKSGDYTWKGSQTGGIIVCTGNVTLQRNFSGLIIAGGDIIFNGATQIKADSDRVEKVFDAEPTVYNMFSKYFRKTISSTIAKDDSSSDQGVCYEHWKKN